MKAGPFFTTIAACLRIEEKTVRVVARELRVVGMLSSGARGVNAPEMTHRDLAQMIVALLATDRPSKAVEMARHFGEMQLSQSEQSKPNGSFPANPDHTFFDLMELWCEPQVLISPTSIFEARGTFEVEISNERPDVANGAAFKLLYRHAQGKIRLGKADTSIGLAEGGLIVVRSITAADLEKIKSKVFADLKRS